MWDDSREGPSAIATLVLAGVLVVVVIISAVLAIEAIEPSSALFSFGDTCLERVSSLPRPRSSFREPMADVQECLRAANPDGASQ
jgi:hypothetical protein